MNFFWMLLLTALFYATYNICIKISSSLMHPILGMLMLQVGALGIGVGAIFYIKAAGIPPVFVPKAVWFGILAGIFVGLAEAASFYVFSKGVPASIGFPIIIGGSVVFSAIFGFLFLKEPLNLSQILAIGFIVGGIVILSSKSS